MADKTYKQWYDYHLKQIKKDKKYENASESALKILAGDMAKRSFDAQQKGATAIPDSIPSPTPTPATGRVGRTGVIPTPTPTPVLTKNPSVLSPTPKPTTQVPANSFDPNSYNNRMQARIAALGIQGYTNTNPKPVPDAIGLMATFTDAQFTEIGKVLKDLGYSVKEKGALKQVLLNYFEELFPSKDYNELLSKLRGRAIAGLGTGEKVPLPQREIPAYDRGALVNLAREVSSKTLMMGQLPPEVEKQIVDDWVKKVEQGTVRGVTQKVKNPKTGKLEEVTKTTRAFNQEAETQALSDRLKTMFKSQYELAQGIQFANDIKDVLSGGL